MKVGLKGLSSHSNSIVLSLKIVCFKRLKQNMSKNLKNHQLDTGLNQYPEMDGC